MQPAAVIFDFDGTIADTEWPIFTMVRTAYRAHGLDVSLDDWVGTIGRAENRPLEIHLAEKLGREPDPEVLARARDDHQAAKDNAPMLPGVHEAITTISNRGCPLGVASSSPSTWVDHHLDRLELRPHFGAVRTRDHVDRGKPAPDLFLAAAAALSVDPADVLVIEDSRHGCTAAKSAGMTCVVVPNQITRLDVPTDADLVIDSLRDFPFTDFGF